MLASSLSCLSLSWEDLSSWAWNLLEPFPHVSGAQTGVTCRCGSAGAIGWDVWAISMGTVAWGSRISYELRMSKQRATRSLMSQKSPGIISTLLLQVVTSLLVCEEKA